MALNPIPPQAYTKETLQKAYSWLLTQGPEIKEMATNQEILVSLFLSTERNGAESLDRPSIQNFRTELKNLADMMGDFENAKKPSEKVKPQVRDTGRDSGREINSGSPLKSPEISSNLSAQTPRTMNSYVLDSNSRAASQANSVRQNDKQISKDMNYSGQKYTARSPSETSTEKLDSLQISLQQLKEGFAAAYESALSDSTHSAAKPQAPLATAAAATHDMKSPSREALNSTLQPPHNVSQRPAAPPHSNFETKTGSAKTIFNESTLGSEPVSSSDSVLNLLDLDDLSMNRVFEVQQALNLSTPTEALRALITLGHKKLKNTFE